MHPSLVFLDHSVGSVCESRRHKWGIFRPFLLTNNVHLKYSRCCNSVRMEYFLQRFSSHICRHRQPADRRLINRKTGISVLLSLYLEQMPVFITVSRIILNISQNHFYQTGWFKICKNMTEQEKRCKRVSLCFKLSIRCMHVKFSAAQVQEKLTLVSSWWYSRKHTRT